jgi:hypothetical protein
MFVISLRGAPLIQRAKDQGERDRPVVPAIDTDVDRLAPDRPFLVHVTAKRDVVWARWFGANIPSAPLIVGTVRLCRRKMIESELLAVHVDDNVFADLGKAGGKHRLWIRVVVTAYQRDTTVECREVIRTKSLDRPSRSRRDKEIDSVEPSRSGFARAARRRPSGKTRRDPDIYELSGLSAAMLSHYSVVAAPFRPYAPDLKGKVESAVGLLGL